MAKGNFIDYVVSDDPNKYPNDGVQSGYYYETVDDVTPEVTAQTPLVTQILEGLVGKAQGATATADKILEGYSAYVGGVLVDGMYDPTTADTDLIPENIREGIDIFGVLGTMLEGISGIDFGEVTLASSKTVVSFSHSLGVVPLWTALVPKGFETFPSGTTMININGMCIYKQTGVSIALGATTNNKSESIIKFNTYYSSCPFPATTYYWIAIA